MIKDKDKKLLTAHAPSIKGGYNCQLQPIKLWAGKSARQQLLVSAAQGDWHAPSEYRVLSFANKKNVFGENMGTSGSSSCYIYAPDFYAENITFENSAGPVGQAVACFVSYHESSPGRKKTVFLCGRSA